MSVKKITLYGLITALALALSYVDHLIPLSVAVPGVKIGLANIAIVFALYKLGGRPASLISLLRILIVSFTFGNAFSMIYSLAGAALSLAVMILLRRTKKFGTVGVSVAGGVAHNAGQIAAAVCITETPGLAYYLPVLCASGVAAGVCVGALAGILVRRIPEL